MMQAKGTMEHATCTVLRANQSLALHYGEIEMLQGKGQARSCACCWRDARGRCKAHTRVRVAGPTHPMEMQFSKHRKAKRVGVKQTKATNKSKQKGFKTDTPTPWNRRFPNTGTPKGLGLNKPRQPHSHSRRDSNNSPSVSKWAQIGAKGKSGTTVTQVRRD